MDKGQKGITGFALGWDMGVHGGDPLLRGGCSGICSSLLPGCFWEEKLFWALLFNLSNKCSPFAQTAEDTCRAGLGLLQGQTCCSSCLKKLLNFAKAFSGPYLGFFLEPLITGTMSSGP